MKLTPAQSKIATDNHRFRIVNCGRRFGKTTLAIEEIKGKAIYSEARIAYFAPTYQQARDIAWQMLIKELKPVIVKANESRLELEVRNLKGTISLIQLRGWESVETARGQAFDMLVIDEIASMRNFWSNWEEVLRPTLTDTKGSVIFISTPRGFNHFYDLYNLENEDKDYKSFHFTSYDNPFLPVEELNKSRQEMTEDRFAQEFLADFRKTEGLVYKEFDRKTHLFEKLDKKIVKTMLGVDFGFTNPTAIVEIKKDDDENYWITNEWYKTQRTNQQIIEAIKSFGAQEVYPDPEAPDKINDLNLAGINVIEVKKSKDSIANGITKIKELFKQNRLYIHSSCVNLITELETYHYPDRRPDQNEQENPVAENNHALDAIRYCFSNEIKSEDAPTYQQRPYEGFSEYEGGTLTKGDKVVMNGLEFERIS